ncbi:hypothetical protein KAR91_66045, partial [Candidatus Pacearchaeota archaeon]|nr:hypothetical protein [Candidatus Pacearchaeota archaeon]
MLKTTTVVPRLFCTDQLFKKLYWLGFNTTGYWKTLSQIILSSGYDTPHQYKDCGNTYFRFQIFNNEEKLHTRIYINYADALAQQIIFLKENK